jgi:hypothetical protein
MTMNAQIELTDNARLDFLRKLIASDLMLTEWEDSFVASFESSSRPSLWFTPGRRISTDKMWMKYGPDLSHPFPTDDVTVQPHRIPPAKAGCCEFLVRGEDGLQRPCNEPAVLQRASGFRYCQQCADKVQSDLNRMGRTIHLVKYP